MGSYRLVLKKEGHHDVIYPVHIGRGEHWDGRDELGIQRPVHMPKWGDIGEDECFVPGAGFGVVAIQMPCALTVVVECGWMIV